MNNKNIQRNQILILLALLVIISVANYVNYYDFEISDTTNFEFNVFTTSGIKLTLIDGKSLKCTNPLQVIIRVEGKNESTIGDCTTTITRRSVKVLKN